MTNAKWTLSMLIELSVAGNRAVERRHDSMATSTMKQREREIAPCLSWNASMPMCTTVEYRNFFSSRSIALVSSSHTFVRSWINRHKAVSIVNSHRRNEQNEYEMLLFRIVYAFLSLSVILIEHLTVIHTQRNHLWHVIITISAMMQEFRSKTARKMWTKEIPLHSFRVVFCFSNPLAREQREVMNWAATHAFANELMYAVSICRVVTSVLSRANAVASERVRTRHTIRW